MPLVISQLSFFPREFGVAAFLAFSLLCSLGATSGQSKNVYLHASWRVTESAGRTPVSDFQAFRPVPFFSLRHNHSEGSLFRPFILSFRICSLNRSLLLEFYGSRYSRLVVSVKRANLTCFLCRSPPGIFQLMPESEQARMNFIIDCANFGLLAFVMVFSLPHLYLSSNKTSIVRRTRVWFAFYSCMSDFTIMRFKWSHRSIFCAST